VLSVNIDFAAQRLHNGPARARDRFPRLSNGVQWTDRLPSVRWTTTWGSGPENTPTISQMDLSDQARRKFLWDNCARLFNLEG
jgi:hypothetical protein